MENWNMKESGKTLWRTLFDVKVIKN